MRELIEEIRYFFLIFPPTHNQRVTYTLAENSLGLPIRVITLRVSFAGEGNIWKARAQTLREVDVR